MSDRFQENYDASSTPSRDCKCLRRSSGHIEQFNSFGKFSVFYKRIYALLMWIFCLT